METKEVKELLGQAEAWEHMFGFSVSMALKCAVELGVPDIIHSQNRPLTITEIASSIGSPSPEISYLTRIMRLLTRKNIFTVDHPSDDGEPIYGLTNSSTDGLTNSSRLLMRDSPWSLSPMLLFQTNPIVFSPWHLFGQCIKEGGGSAFEKANGCGIWEVASRDAEFNKCFNAAMACGAPIVTRGILTGYKDGFASIAGTLMDVGGGIGAFMSEIVKNYPHIKVVNFDLPHVVATAPEYPGVSQIGGNMFEAIPKADSIILKSVLHDWGDEDCVKILRNCRKSIDEKTGKLIIVDIVLEPEGDDPLDSTRLAVDLVMMAHCKGGMERTRKEWKKIMEEGGFPNYKIIKIPALPSVIEAYPA